MAENASVGSGYEAKSLPQEAALRVAGVAAVQSALQGRQGSSSVVGGRSVGGVVAAPQTSITSWGGLGQTISNIIEPKIAAKQRENFWKGVTAARAGVTAVEAVADDSPLSKIFGPSGYTQGVQFYSAQEKIASYNQSMIENANDFARLSPEELGLALNRESEKFSTGDPATDGMIQQSWIEQTGPSLAVVNKTRFAQDQRAATSSFVANLDTQAKVLKAMGPHLTQGTASGQDMIGATYNWAKAAERPPGMSEEAYHSVLPNLARSYAEQGNYHALTAMQNSGVLSFMTVDQRTKLDEYTDRKATRHAEEFRRTRGREMSDWKASLDAGAMTPAQYDENIRNLQFTFTAETGNQAWLVPSAEREANLVKGRSNVWEAEAAYAKELKTARAKASTEQEKNAADARTMQEISAQMSLGNLGSFINLGGDPSLVAQSFNKAYSQYDEGERVQLLTSNYSNSAYVDRNVKQQLQSGLRAISEGQGYSPAFETTFNHWKNLSATTAGQATAAAYYDPEQTTRMNRFNSLRNQSIEPVVAFKMAFQDPMTDAVDWTKTHGVDKAVKGVINDNYDRWFSKDNLSEQSKRLVASLAMRQVGLSMQNTGLTEEQATFQALHNLKANGLETYGGEAWVRTVNQAPLTQYITHGKPNDAGVYDAVRPETLSKVFSAVYERGVKAAGLDKAEVTQVLRLPDAQGKAHFAVMGLNKQGQMQSFQFSSEDISKAYDEDLRKFVKPGNGEFGKSTNMMGVPGKVLAPDSMRFINQAPARIY